MAGFQVKGLISVGLEGLGDINRMSVFLNQAANAGDNLSRAFSANQLAASYAARAASRLGQSFQAVSGSAMAFEDIMARAAGVVNNNQVAIDNLRTAAMTLRGSVHGPHELAEAILELNRAGLDASQSLKEVTTVSNLASVAGISVAESAVMGANAFKAWAGPFDTMADIMNKFNSAANMSTFNIKSLAKAMEYVQRAAIPMGVSVDTATAMMVMMAPITGPNSKAGTAASGMMQRMANPAVQKKLAAQFKLSPYGANGVRKDPLDFLGEVWGKASTMRDPKYDALAHIVAGTKDKATLAGIKRLFEGGLQANTAAGPQQLYGMDAVRHLRGSLTSGMDLAGQAKLIADSPGGQWAQVKAQAMRALTDLGKGFLDVFVTLKPTIMQLIDGFRGLLAATGPIIPILASFAGVVGMLRVATMGSMALFSSMRGLVPNLGTGPQMSMVGDILGGAAPGALAAGFASTNRGGIFARIHGQRQADFVTKLRGRGMKDAHIQKLMTDPRYAGRSEALMNSMVPGGASSAWYQKYGGAGGFMASTAHYGEMGRAKFGGSGIGGAIGQGLGVGFGAAASVASGLFATIGPLAAFGAVVWGVTNIMEKYQKRLEDQEKEAAKDKGFLDQLPLVSRALMQMKWDKKAGTYVYPQEFGQAAAQNPMLNQFANFISEQGGDFFRASGGTMGKNRQARMAMMGSYQMMADFLKMPENEQKAIAAIPFHENPVAWTASRLGFAGKLSDLAAPHSKTERAKMAFMLRTNMKTLEKQFAAAGEGDVMSLDRGGYTPAQLDADPSLKARFKDAKILMQGAQDPNTSTFSRGAVFGYRTDEARMAEAAARGIKSLQTGHGDDVVNPATRALINTIAGVAGVAFGEESEQFRMLRQSLENAAAGLIEAGKLGVKAAETTIGANSWSLGG